MVSAMYCVVLCTLSEPNFTMRLLLRDGVGDRMWYLSQYDPTYRQLASYMICWFPYACTSIAETAGYMPQGQVRVTPHHPCWTLRHCVTASLHYTLLQASYFLFAVSTLMTKTSVCTDPIIYFWLNTQVCKIYWLVASYTMFISISILNLFSQFQFRKELLSLTGRLEREPSQSMTGISLTSFYTRPIIRSAGQSEDRNNTSQKV